MRILRKACPREADVVYRALVLGHGAEEIQGWLNQRAAAGGHPERFSLKDATVLIISGAMIRKIITCRPIRLRASN